MFGKNAVSEPFNPTGRDLLVKELFYTIQGEGPDAGQAAIFLRLSKCNLRCWFCDTDFEGGEMRELRELCAAIGVLSRANRCSLVVITGGEPLLQNIVPLVECLNGIGIRCSVETAGTVYYPQLADVFDAACHNGNLIVCSPKTPKVHTGIERITGAWKYVIKAGQRFNISTQVPGAVTPKELFRPIDVGVPIYIQPCDEQDEALNSVNLADCVKMVMEDPRLRLGVQMHKLANVP